MRQSEMKWRIILKRLSERREVTIVSQERILTPHYLSDRDRDLQRNSQRITGLARTVRRKKIDWDDNCSFTSEFPA